MCLALLVPAATVESARPPTLLTFAVSAGPTAKAGGLCVSRVDGSRRFRLTAGSSDRDPDWSPRGKFVAFGTDGPFEIRVADTRGKLLYVLDHYYGEAEILQMDPVWSPDGNRIAFAGHLRTYGSIYIVNRWGGNPRSLDKRPGEFAATPTWSPDGRRLAFAKSSSVYTIRVDGSDRRLVAEAASEPDWSPKGSKLAYTRSVGAGSEIVVAKTDGTNPKVLTDSPERESNPAWSPDGKLIAFERTDEGSNRSWIVVVRSDTGARVSTIRGPYNLHEPAWRPPTVLPTAKRRACG